MTATFRLQAASLHEANVDWMSSCLYSTRWIVIGRASRPVVGCSYVGVFPGVFPYGRHPRFRDFDPVVPVDVVRVEADLDRFLDSYVVFIYTVLYVHIIHFDNQFWPETSEQLTCDLHRYLVTTTLLDATRLYSNFISRREMQLNFSPHGKHCYVIRECCWATVGGFLVIHHCYFETTRCSALLCIF